MDKQKQIEEMAKDIKNTWFVKSNGDICGTNEKLKKNDINMIAQQLVSAGYRKIPENAVVLTREEYGELKQAKTLLEFREETIKLLEDANIRYAETLELKVNIKERKETAEKFAERLKAKMPCEEVFKGIWIKIDETLKEITDKEVQNGN